MKRQYVTQRTVLDSTPGPPEFNIVYISDFTCEAIFAKALISKALADPPILGVCVGRLGSNKATYENPAPPSPNSA